VTFESEYINLLIKQYWEKPKAYAEIAMKASSWRRSFVWLSSFENAFDLDSATGDRLDIIGRIVGIGRAIPYAVPKIAFGFDENPNSRGFDDLFSPLNDRAPFQDLFESESTELVLDDNAYRLFIRAKIRKIYPHLIWCQTTHYLSKTRLLIFLADWPMLQIIMT